MSLRVLLTLSGGLEAFAGVLTLISPASVVSLLLGGAMDPAGSVVARLAGTGMFALGLACLRVRDNVESAAGRAISLGMTSYNVLASVVIFWAAAGLDLGGPFLWAAGIAHAVLGVLFVLALLS